MPQPSGTPLTALDRAKVRMLRRIPPTVRGKARLARAVLGGVRRRRDVVVTLADGSRLLMPSLAEPVAFDSLIHGVYEPDVAQRLRDLLPPGGVFVDVGANVGVFSILASRIVGPSGRVVAIEASPGIASYLAHNLALNACANVRQVAVAASDSGPRTVRFWPAPDDKFGMGALAPQFDAASVEIEADTIDHILAAQTIDRADVIKMDVEGFEAAALAGAGALLSGPRPPAIVFEFADWAESRAGFTPGTAQRLLLDRGYRLSRLEADGTLTALAEPITTGSANVLASPS